MSSRTEGRRSPGERASAHARRSWMTRASALSLSMSSADNAIAATPVTATRAARGAPGAPRALPPGLAARPLGCLGILGFSFSLPATRLAVADLDPWLVAFGRATVAAALAAVYLLATRAPRPTREQARSLAIVAAGVIVGFPLLTSLALEVQTAAHGAVVIAILPAATAVAAVKRAHEHPSRAFWLAACAGLVAVLAFVVSQGVVRPRRPATPSCSAPSCCARSATPRAARSAARSAGRRRSAGRSCSARPLTASVTGRRDRPHGPARRRHRLAGLRLRRRRLDVPGLLRLVRGARARRGGAHRPGPARPAGAHARLVGGAARRARRAWPRYSRRWRCWPAWRRRSAPGD